MKTRITTRANKSLLRDTQGAGLVEYVLLIGLVAIACIGAWAAFGGNLRTGIQGQGTRMVGVAQGTAGG